MRHLGLGVGHKRDEHDGEPMEVDPLDLGVPNVPDHTDEQDDYSERNTACQDEDEEQEGDDSEEEDDLDDEDGPGSENELEEDFGYDEL
jgi:hypothetical protein